MIEYLNRSDVSDVKTTAQPYTTGSYGKRIPTRYMVKTRNRWYRVYVCQFSNAGTAYIKTKGNPFLVVTEDSLSAALSDK